MHVSSPTSYLLFGIYWVTKSVIHEEKIATRWIHTYSILEDLDFVNDIALFSRRRHSRQHTQANIGALEIHGNMARVATDRRLLRLLVATSFASLSSKDNFFIA